MTKKNKMGDVSIVTSFLPTDARTTITIRSPQHWADPELWRTVASFASNVTASLLQQSTRRGSQKPSASLKNVLAFGGRSINGLQGNSDHERNDHNR